MLLLAKLLVPEAYFIMAASLALPFAAIGAMVLWRQLKLPSAARVAATVEAAIAFAVLEGIFRTSRGILSATEGYTVHAA